MRSASWLNYIEMAFYFNINFCSLNIENLLYICQLNSCNVNAILHFFPNIIVGLAVGYQRREDSSRTCRPQEECQLSSYQHPSQ